MSSTSEVLQTAAFRSSSRMIYQIPETRQVILDSAWALFLKNGFFETQMRDVAALAKISQSSLYRYFQDKTDLASTLVESVFSQFMADQEWMKTVPEGADASVWLRCYLKNHWLHVKFRNVHLFMAEYDAFYSGSRIPKGSEKAVQFREELNRKLQFSGDPVIAQLLLRGVADGSLRNDLDEHFDGVTLLNAVRSLHQRVLLRGDVMLEALPGEAEKMPFRLVDFLLAGLKPSREATA